MKAVRIYLSDESLSGRVTMWSTTSKIKMIRTDRSNVNLFQGDLNKPGVYLLIIGTDIYVGESDKISSRITNSHRDNIHTHWHTVIGFPCSDAIEEKGRKFLENALCELVWENGWNCITRTPQRRNCNRNYREREYLRRMNADDRDSCNQYLEDIKYYLSFIKGTIFNRLSSDNQAISSQRRRESQTYYRCNGSGASARGYDSANGFTVCKDSIVSHEIGTSLPQRQKELRLRLINDGTILGNKFTREFEFVSRATASNIIWGRSSNAHIEWKREEEQV